MYERPKFGQVPELVNIYFDTFGYITDGYFVDIGAFDCVQWSNTYVLAMAGWSGLMVEPQPQLIEACQAVLEDYPNVTLVEAAVSDWNGQGDLRLAGSVSTISESQARIYQDTKEMGYLFEGEPKTILVDIIDTDTLLRDNNVPVGFQVMSIDVEGSELNVLRAFDIDYYQPRLVIIEAHEGWIDAMKDKASGINDYFRIAGYEKVYSDAINNIYRPA
jgi:FkbM family methyltransferase